MQLRPLVFALLLATVPLAALPTAAAAGSSQPDAELIGAGTYSGTAAERQGVWYRVVVPDGQVLHVAYTLYAGDSWNDLALVDENGAQVAATRSGGAALYDPDGTDAWIQVETYWGAADYAFTVSFVNPVPQNDAGSGLDAGNSLPYALPISPGRIAGGVRESSGDTADWYRLDAPAGAILDVFGAENSYVSIHASDGRVLGEITYFDSSWTPRSYTTLVTGEPILFNVGYGTSYAFQARVTLPGDLAVSAIEVHEVPLRVGSDTTEHSLTREVFVTLTNLGDGPTRGGSVSIATEHDGPTGTRVLGIRAVDLAPGESATIVVPWDTTGQVGDMRVVARASNEHDTDVENDVGVAASYVLVGGSPVDADLLNHEVRAGASRVTLEYGHRAGAQTPAGFVGSQGGATGVF